VHGTWGKRSPKWQGLGGKKLHLGISRTSDLRKIRKKKMVKLYRDMEEGKTSRTIKRGRKSYKNSRENFRRVDCRYSSNPSRKNGPKRSSTAKSLEQVERLKSKNCGL